MEESVKKTLGKASLLAAGAILTGILIGKLALPCSEYLNSITQNRAQVVIQQKQDYPKEEGLERFVRGNQEVDSNIAQNSAEAVVQQKQDYPKEEGLDSLARGKHENNYRQTDNEQLPVDYEVPQLKRENALTDVIGKSYEMPVFVKFTAKWCGPCISLKGAYMQAANEFNETHPGKAVLMEADTDLFKKENTREIFTQQGIYSIGSIGGIPRVEVFYKGKLKRIIYGDDLIYHQEHHSLQEFIRETAKDLK